MNITPTNGVTFHPISNRDKEYHAEHNDEQCYYCQEDLFTTDANGKVTEAAGEVLGHFAGTFFPEEEGKKSEEQSLHLVHRNCLAQQATRNETIRQTGTPHLPNGTSESNSEQGYYLDCGICKRKITNMNQFIPVSLFVELSTDPMQQQPEIVRLTEPGRELICNTWAEGITAGAVGGMIAQVFLSDRTIGNIARGALSGVIVGGIAILGAGINWNSLTTAAREYGYVVGRTGLGRIDPDVNLTSRMIAAVGSGISFGLRAIADRSITAINGPQQNSAFFHIASTFAWLGVTFHYRQDLMEFDRALQGQIRNRQISFN